MTVCVCLASRGRPELLNRTIKQLDQLARLDSTIISVGLDSDDIDAQSVEQTDRVMVSVAAREDALGQKYNRCAAGIDADVFVLWADDVITTTEGWDEKLDEVAKLFTDGIGIIYFGKIEGVLQPGIAVTRKMMDAMGFFCVPYFPYWWHDTWIDEIGRMADRILSVDIKMELLQGMAGKSRGVREILFWAEFFDRMRDERRRVAENIIREGNDQPWRKVQVRSRIRQVEQWVNHRNSILRDPKEAARLEKHYSFDAPADDRYLRLKAKAEEMMKGLAAA